MTRSYIPVAVRRLVYARAKGCCEYCLISEEHVLVPHEVDHVIAQKHGGQTEAQNLALSCTLCNKYKGSDLASLDPETGEIMPLYNPRRDNWVEHFSFVEGMIVPKTAIGRVTVRLLQFNRPEQVLERQLLNAAGLLRTPDNDQ
jgi:hypothetical protein